MSGLHSARKSVELDEGALREFGAELERLGESPTIGMVPPTEVAEPAPDPSTSRLNSPGDAAFSDSLLSACPRCNWVPDPEMMVFFEEDERTHGAEEFRALRSQLYSVRKQKNLKSILVASALPKEGRSFVATNLARVLALQAGCRVLLIDADLRNPRLHSAFGTSVKPGFSEYLLQESEEFAVMQRGHADGLYLIPAGRSVQGQTELVANGRLQSLIHQVEPLFDWIIVDSPAAMPVTDAGLLSTFCDGVLLLVRSHSTPFDIVKKARGKFREDALVGVVLNKIEANGSSRT